MEDEKNRRYGYRFDTWQNGIPSSLLLIIVIIDCIIIDK